MSRWAHKETKGAAAKNRYSITSSAEMRRERAQPLD